MILKEVQHSAQHVSGGKPLLRDTFHSPIPARYPAQVIVHPHLVIQVVEARVHISAIQPGVVALADELHLGILLLHLPYRPCEELHRHHLCHVHTEGIHFLARPEEQDIAHLHPCVRNRRKLLLAAALIEHAVVQFHRLVPVIARRMCREAVVSRRFRGKLLIACRLKTLRRKTLAGDIVEVVER